VNLLRDAIEDSVEMHDEGLKKQIKTVYRDYLAGRTRGADEFLAELRRIQNSGRPVSE
jgi:hypothetical protein